MHTNYQVLYSFLTLNLNPGRRENSQNENTAVCCTWYMEGLCSVRYQPILLILAQRCQPFLFETPKVATKKMVDIFIGVVNHLRAAWAPSGTVPVGSCWARPVRPLALHGTPWTPICHRPSMTQQWLLLQSPLFCRHVSCQSEVSSSPRGLSFNPFRAN